MPDKKDPKRGLDPDKLDGTTTRRASIISLLIIIALIVYLIVNMGGSFGAPQTKSLTTSEFVAAVQDGRVDTATYATKNGTLSGTYWENKGDVGNDSKLEHYSSTYVGTDNLDVLMQDHSEVKFDVNTSTDDWLETILISVVPTILIVAVMIYFMNQMQGQNNQAMSFGRTKAKTTEETRPKVKFKDVAGIDEAVEELKEIRDFLKDPDRYHRMGARIPRGVLLVGPPGTGKTLLAKAVAGEAGVPFFSISGSDFVEMFVGVGASRVRDLFKQAKEASPSIIFIDEIDAVARRRGTGMGGGHDEREQTLNQLLVEMDGFGVNEGIIVMAATNRVDILDPAILRPGRFDRRVVVGPPDVMGREEILKVHAKNKPLAEDVDLKQIAQTTAGFTGAELENLLNEAAIMAAKDRRRFVRQSDIKSAFIKVGIGAEKRSKVISDKEKRITAYHETGHAILFHMLPDMEAVYTISIIPTGPGAAGYTMPQPENDDMFQTRGKMMQYITVCLGGRVAEELIFDDITTGASQDIKQATATARSMITKYGMSENLGLVAYDSDSDEVFIGRDWGHTKSYSENVAAAIDEEVRQMIEKCHDQAKQIILEHSYVLHECAKQLMEKEKLSRAEFEAIFEQEAQMTGTAPEVSGEI